MGHKWGGFTIVIGRDLWCDKKAKSTSNRLLGKEKEDVEVKARIRVTYTSSLEVYICTSRKVTCLRLHRKIRSYLFRECLEGRAGFYLTIPSKERKQTRSGDVSWQEADSFSLRVYFNDVSQAQVLNHPWVGKEGTKGKRTSILFLENGSKKASPYTPKVLWLRLFNENPKTFRRLAC